MVRNQQTRHAWSHTWRVAGITITVLLVLILFLHQQTVLYLMGLWNKLDAGEYGHGYLVIAISLYLVVRNRHRLSLLIPCPSYMALPAVVASSLLWLFAVLVDVNMMQTVALLVLVLATVWMLLGHQATRVLVFPILFIGFALPVWYLLSPLLQALAADVVFWLMRILKVPALRHEYTIILPAGQLTVEESCSGLRYLLAGLTLGTLYAYLNFQDTRARLIVVLISAFSAIFANIVRVFIVVYLGYATEMQHPFVYDHLMLGWYLFGGVVVVLMLVDAWLFRRNRPPVSINEIKHDITEHDDPEPEPVACKKGAMQFTVMLFAAALIATLGPASVYVIKNQITQDTYHVDINLPESMGGWKVQDDANDDWMPVYYGAISQKRTYHRDGAHVGVYLGYYQVQKQGEELINQLNRISNEDVWATGYSRARSTQVDDQAMLEQLLEKGNGKKRLVWYWYRVSGHRTTNIYMAKVLQVWGLLIGRQQSYVVAVAADMNDTPESARKTLREFVFDAESSIYNRVEEKT